MELFFGVIPLLVCTFLEFKKELLEFISGLRPRDLCRDAFKVWGILPLQSQYIPY
jgi:hypothetical protein